MHCLLCAMLHCSLQQSGTLDVLLQFQLTRPVRLDGCELREEGTIGFLYALPQCHVPPPPVCCHRTASRRK